MIARMTPTGLLSATAAVGLAVFAFHFSARAQQPDANARGSAAQQQPQQDEPARRAIQERMQKQPAASAEVKKAVVVLRAIGDSGVSGELHLQQTGQGLKITGEIRGLKPGKHGFHVHEFGDLTDTQKGESAGDHYAPRNNPHGRPDAGMEERHAGDFGNIEANEQGVARVDYTDSIARLNGPHSILGRALVVHADEDKFTQPSGDAGDRVAFGVIGVAKGGMGEASPAQKREKDPKPAEKK